MANTAVKRTDDEKAAWMITRVTGTGDKLALVDAAKLEPYERSALVDAYDNDENTEQAREAIEHAAQRVTLQEKSKAKAKAAENTEAPPALPAPPVPEASLVKRPPKPSA